MITAWDVYWVMQLDSIAALFFGLAIVGACVAVIAGIATLCEDWRPKKSLAVVYSCALVAVTLAAALTPSSKTAAAMIVLPAIANNETLHAEAGKLYELAKKALADAVGDKEGHK